MSEQTNFGYQKVNSQEKTRLVNGVFSSVAGRYDVMNDLMSMGLHRFWKWFALEVSGVNQGMSAVDLACGSGDLLLSMARRMNKKGQLIGVDPSLEMLQQARERVADSGFHGFVKLLQGSAEELPVDDSSVDLITCSFGFRNTTDKEQSLRSCLRALKPGGRLLILEFSHPQSMLLKTLYDGYSKLLPSLGGLVAGDSDSYKYLVESIRVHPDQQNLKAMMEQQGFAMVSYTNLHGGIVAIHSGYKV